MIREVKFRGISLDTGKFVYGCFIKTNLDAPAIVFGDGEQEVIDVETLGQLTGLHDRNGVEIYESDVVTWYINDHDVTGEIYYDGQSFDMRSPERGCIGWDALRGEVKVIGNIYENSDLQSTES